MKHFQNVLPFALDSVSFTSFCEAEIWNVSKYSNTSCFSQIFFLIVTFFFCSVFWYAQNNSLSICLHPTRKITCGGGHFRSVTAGFASAHYCACVDSTHVRWTQRVGACTRANGEPSATKHNYFEVIFCFRCIYNREETDNPPWSISPRGRDLRNTNFFKMVSVWSLH